MFDEFLRKFAIQIRAVLPLVPLAIRNQTGHASLYERRTCFNLLSHALERLHLGLTGSLHFACRPGQVRTRVQERVDGTDDTGVYRFEKFEQTRVVLFGGYARDVRARD